MFIVLNNYGLNNLVKEKKKIMILELEPRRAIPALTF